MTQEQLNAIESLFGLKLPADYASLLLQYPAHLPTVIRGYELQDEPTYLADQNRSVREGALWGVTWPPHYFVVGDDGSGNLYCIDTSQADSPILVFDHEDKSFREEATSLAQWLPQLQSLHAS